MEVCIKFPCEVKRYFALSLYVKLVFCIGSLEGREKGVDDLLVQGWSPHLSSMAWSAASQTMVQ